MKRIHSVFSIFVCFCTLIWAGPIWAAFVDNGNGTVTDTSTGLTWQQDTPEDVVNWKQALAYCESLSLGGDSDWRLPTIKELRSLVDYSRNNPSIDITNFPNTLPSFYWSSTTYASNISSAWGVFFLNGSGNSSNKQQHHPGARRSWGPVSITLASAGYESQWTGRAGYGLISNTCFHNSQPCVRRSKWNIC